MDHQAFQAVAMLPKFTRQFPSTQLPKPCLCALPSLDHQHPKCLVHTRHVDATLSIWQLAENLFQDYRRELVKLEERHCTPKQVKMEAVTASFPIHQPLNQPLNQMKHMKQMKQILRFYICLFHRNVWVGGEEGCKSPFQPFQLYSLSVLRLPRMAQYPRSPRFLKVLLTLVYVRLLQCYMEKPRHAYASVSMQCSLEPSS